MSIVLAVLAVFAIIYAVPFVVYGAASAVWGLAPPEGASPGRFLVGVAVTKLGTAVAFVVIYWLGADVWADRWLLYAALWFAMFASSEVGEAISARTSVREAGLGIVSEAVYAPAAALAVRALLGA